MRLISTLTEDGVQERLSASNAALRAGGGNPTLRAALLAYGADPTTAIVLDWVPEQGEDLYTVLDGTRRVLNVELSRDVAGEPPRFNAVPFAEYRAAVARGSRLQRLRFAVAMDLLGEAVGDGA